MTKKVLLQIGILVLAGSVSVCLAQAGSVGSAGQTGSGAVTGGGEAKDAGKTVQTGAVAGTPQSDSGNDHIRTVEGCISQDNGNFMLTEKKNGHRFQLQSGSTDLSAHVGHEVKIHGMVNAPDAATMSSNGNTENTMGKKGNKAEGEKTLTVDKLDMVSSTCSGKAAGSGTKSPY